MADQLNLEPVEKAGADALPGISVVVPMYNEAECVATLIERLEQLQQTAAGQYELEFVFVDDASSDGTAELVERHAQRLPIQVVRHTQNRGIAAAIDTGVRAASQELVASIDADCSYDPETILRLAPLMAPGVVMATASPYHPEGGVLHVPAWRIALSRAASGMYSWIMPQRLTCYTCCVRVYRRSAALECRCRNGGFVGVAELAWQLQRQGGRVAEAPAVLRPRVAGVSKMRTLRAARSHLRLMASIAACRVFPFLFRQSDASDHGSVAREPAL